MTFPKPMSQRKRYALHSFTLEELREELDRRARAAGKPSHQWDEKRSVYMRRLAADLRQTLDGVLEDRVPGGKAVAIKQARVRSLKERIAKYERYAMLAEADEQRAAEARRRP